MNEKNPVCFSHPYAHIGLAPFKEHIPQGTPERLRVRLFLILWGPKNTRFFTIQMKRHCDGWVSLVWTLNLVFQHFGHVRHNRFGVRRGINMVISGPGATCGSRRIYSATILSLNVRPDHKFWIPKLDHVVWLYHWCHHDTGLGDGLVNISYKNALVLFFFYLVAI